MLIHPCTGLEFSHVLFVFVELALSCWRKVIKTEEVPIPFVSTEPQKHIGRVLAPNKLHSLSQKPAHHLFMAI
ncbi:hypothetical protein L2E82_44940 [Cichorium intybus]|uniref:Uncharacterized protein n=1 Tax=Cichorium intybus TaxID=13427 RepID=A0ACB8ZSK7_CICIN|nr:hypothetical protein L2E82_44940 [Cichorium intybus]